MLSYKLPHVRQLESESIFVLRETAAQFDRPVLVGASLGGIASLWATAYAKNGPIASALVLVDIATRMEQGGAERIRELVTADDATLRQVAARALADMADAGAVEPLLKAADIAKGFDRTKQTGACLQLAEKLLILGRKKEANRIYKHLRDTRKDPAEAYIRETAEHGLKQTS